MNVTPPFAAEDETDGWARYANDRSGLSHRETLPAEFVDTTYVGLSELGGMVQFATLRDTPRSPSAFGVHVSHVVALRSEEQVVRIDAGRVVALVKDEQLRRDRPIGKFPGDSVSASALASTTVRHNAVSPFGLRTEPPPTAPGLVHPIPETFA